MRLSKNSNLANGYFRDKSISRRLERIQRRICNAIFPRIACVRHECRMQVCRGVCCGPALCRRAERQPQRPCEWRRGRCSSLQSEATVDVRRLTETTLFWNSAASTSWTCTPHRDARTQYYIKDVTNYFGKLELHNQKVKRATHSNTLHIKLKI